MRYVIDDEIEPGDKQGAKQSIQVQKAPKIILQYI